MNPAVVAARWIARRHPSESVLVLGGPGVVAPLHDLGIETVEERADVVLVGWDDVLTYAQLRAACESIWAGALLLATSTASVFSVNGRPAPGWSGAVAAGIRQTTGVKAVNLGKPSPAALREVCRALRTTPRRTLVVGDDLTLEIGDGPPGRSAHRPRPHGHFDSRGRRSPARRPPARRGCHRGIRAAARVGSADHRHHRRSGA